MHPRYFVTINQVDAWAQEDENIQAVVVIGSQARRLQPSDQWSDLDLMVLANHPEVLLANNHWFDRFGKVVCFFDEVVPLYSMNWNWCVKRVLFDDYRDVDFSILPTHYLDEVLEVNKDILSKGYQVMYDSGSCELEDRLRALTESAKPEHMPPISEQELQAVVSNLLYHVIWAMKKIQRNELWVAMNCINCYMKELLLRLIEAHNTVFHQTSASLQYGGRFLEQRTAPGILAQLACCFTGYDRTQAVAALQQIINLTWLITKEISDHSGYPVDQTMFDAVRAMYDGMEA